MKSRVRYIVTFIFLAFIAVMAIMNYRIIAVPTAAAFEGKSSFAEWTGAISKGYSSNSLWGKTNFIEINGAYARLSGRRAYNEITLLNDGSLGGNLIKPMSRDVSKICSSITELSDYLKENGTEFIYVQAPYEVDVEGSLLPYGIENSRNENANDLLAGLEQNGVDTLDLRSYISSSPEQVASFMYRTDHHWSGDGAFAGFAHIMSELKSKDEELDISYTDESMWNRYVNKNWFLGAHGKRVGTLFGGTDDLIWYEPLFETEMSCAVPHKTQFFYGNFKDANIRDEYIDRCDYYNDSPYCLYIGGDYPIVHHRNAEAPNQKKVLMIKDSFTLPVQAFMSTEFSEVDVIDPRHYKASGIAEYCLWNRPDIVIMMVNPGSIQTKAYAKLGTDSVRSGEKTEVKSKEIINIEANDEDYNYAVVTRKLKPGREYQISIGQIDVTEGRTDGVSLVIYDREKNKTVNYTILDVNYYAANGPAEWSFRVPKNKNKNARYDLLLYAGLKGSTKGTGVSYSDVVVYQYD